MPPQERRFTLRAKVEVEVEMEWGSEVLRGKAKDMSDMGVFVAMKDPLWVGATCAARLHLDGQVVPVTLVVKRVQPQVGIGAMFVDLPPESRQKIAEYLKALQK